MDQRFAASVLVKLAEHSSSAASLLICAKAPQRLREWGAKWIDAWIAANRAVSSGWQGCAMAAIGRALQRDEATQLEERIETALYRIVRFQSDNMDHSIDIALRLSEHLATEHANCAAHTLSLLHWSSAFCDEVRRSVLRTSSNRIRFVAQRFFLPNASRFFFQRVWQFKNLDLHRTDEQCCGVPEFAQTKFVDRSESR